MDTVFKVLHTHKTTMIQTETEKTLLRHTFELIYRETDGYSILILCMIPRNSKSRIRMMKANLILSNVSFSQVCEWVQANINIFN